MIAEKAIFMEKKINMDAINAQFNGDSHFISEYFSDFCHGTNHDLDLDFRLIGKEKLMNSFVVGGNAYRKKLLLEREIFFK
ncbi:MAG: hypothetical protein V4629_03250 [Pseudomonadota bacterium]